MGIIGVVIAAIVAYIAWQQHKTNRDKLRLDLYDRRFKVFDRVKIFVTDVFLEQRVSEEQLGQYRGATAEATFLFKDDILEYLKDVTKKAYELQRVNRAIKTNLSQEKHRQATDNQRVLLKWFGAQSAGGCVKRFKEYLRFQI